MYDMEPCDLLITHMDVYKQNKEQTFPLLMFADHDYIYMWEGPIVADKVYNEFVKNNQYKKFKTWGGMTTP